MAQEEYDVVVVGTGWYGLAAAKTQIELHPTQKILVVEAESSVGGTWGENRIYPGLKSNNLHGTYEHPDFPMAEERYGVKDNKEHIPGAVMHRYLTDFAKRFGIFDRTRFNTTVEAIQPSKTGGWALTTSGEQGGTMSTKKLILATGLTSRPNFPQYKGAETFGGPIFHARDFCRQGHTVQTAQNVVIVGGAKSAYDVADAYTSTGAQVDLVIRPDGNGPIWISYPYVTPLKKRLEQLLHVRFLTWLSPCIFQSEDKYAWWPRRFLHGSTIGRWIVDRFWGILGGDVIQLIGFNSHPETKKLHPWNAAFWIGSGLSIHNFDEDFFEKVKKGRIRVHIDSVDHLSKGTIHLTSGETLAADVVVCATGWRKDPGIQFLDFPSAGLGLPHSLAEQQKLIVEADEKVLSTLPRLRAQPSLKFKPDPDTYPYRLYRFIVPPTFISARNIAFTGIISNVCTALTANIQALWIAAFFDDRLDRLARTEQEITEEVMLHTQWMKWRHPTGYGARFPDMAFDGLPYLDLLLNDLGMEVNRKQNVKKEGVWAELFWPYGPRDYEGLVEEWRGKHPE